MKHIGNGDNTIANAIWLLLTYFYIDRQLFTTAFEIIAICIFTWSLISSWNCEFCVLFIEHRFCPSIVSWSSFLAWDWFSKIFWYLSIVKSVNIQFHFISFISLSGNVLPFNFICNCSPSFFSSLESSQSSCCFSWGSGSSRITVSVSIGFGLVILGRTMVTFPYFLDN